ncbi:hypothetical protein OSB04_031594 [Centaurea solstitialis]|uniref:Uncharacterized protein n=1 Tax=Centaurea solstitialis TaxID=347529 RepID=A0AA38SMX9_9ASTR|nr:hypothetical protein OSB04_031594 [Centaurea solstitialis]
MEFDGTIGHRSTDILLSFNRSGTLLNSQSWISATNANPLREASSSGVKVVIATGKPSSRGLPPHRVSGAEGRHHAFSRGPFKQWSGEVQKVLFLDSAEGVAGTLRPYREQATRGRSRLCRAAVQAQANMLEIVPPATSKDNGVKKLLDHFGASTDEVMGIGDRWRK